MKKIISLVAFVKLGLLTLMESNVIVDVIAGWQVYPPTPHSIESEMIESTAV